MNDVADGEVVDLAAGLAAAALVLKEPESVEEALARLAVVALSVIPGVEQCGISVADRKSVSTVASTDGMVDRLDQLQYRLDEGPCLDAIRLHTWWLWMTCGPRPGGRGSRRRRRKPGASRRWV
jgi:hypothetical protein